MTDQHDRDRIHGVHALVDGCLTENIHRELASALQPSSTMVMTPNAKKAVELEKKLYKGSPGFWPASGHD